MDENEELKGKITQLESENATFKADIEKLTKSVSEKDNKISELQEIGRASCRERE